jgi:hypothetical protein
MRREGERRDIFERYIGEIALACNQITGVDAKKLYEALLEQARHKTAVADMKLDDEGKSIKEDPADQEGVLIVAADPEPIPRKPGTAGAAATATNASKDGSTPPFKLSKSEAAMLKVHASHVDDQPALIETAPVPRSKRSAPSRTSAPSKPAKPAPAPSPRSTPQSASKSSAEAKPGTAVKPAAEPGPKLRMRLVNGKLVPVQDDRKLF